MECGLGCWFRPRCLAGALRHDRYGSPRVRPGLCPLRPPLQYCPSGKPDDGPALWWGGIDGKRDCSAATRDVLAPFGLWLPRNSSAQAKSGIYISLEDLSGEEKEQAILKSGVPFGTLIWMPGHILLYIGQYKGHPVVFHDVWGMRTLEPDGREGRKVIGKAVITTLRVGEIYSRSWS